MNRLQKVSQLRAVAGITRTFMESARMNGLQALNQFRTLLGILHGSRAFTGPVQVNLNLTNRCNVRCVHCYFYSPHIEKPNMVELRRARRDDVALPDLEHLKELQKLQADADRTLATIDALAALGARRFQFGGNGEPFVHGRVLEIMRRAKENGGYCIVNTNGTLLKRETTDALMDMKFDDLRITTMAGDRETYCRTHPGSKETLFDDLRENLLYLAAQKKARPARKPRVTVTCVIVAQNCERLVDFARFAGEVEAQEVTFRPFDDVKDPGFAALIPSEEVVREQLSEARTYLESEGIKNNAASVLRVFKKKLNTTGFYDVVPCYLGWLALRIDVNGNIYPCCRSYDPIGNAFEQGFEKVWYGETYRQWRKSALTINKRKTPVKGCECHTCVHHAANMRVYRMLHPFKSRSSLLAQLRPQESGDSE